MKDMEACYENHRIVSDKYTLAGIHQNMVGALSYTAR